MGAHGQSDSDNFNIDMISGRRLTFDDLVASTKQPAIIALCADQVARQIKEKLSDD